MNLYSDKIVRCPYFPDHEVSEKKLKWHIVKCKCEHKWKELNPQLKQLRCPLNWQHLFFKEEDLAAHIVPGVCEKGNHNQTLEVVFNGSKPKDVNFFQSIAERYAKPDIGLIALGKRKALSSCVEKTDLETISSTLKRRCVEVVDEKENIPDNSQEVI